MDRSDARFVTDGSPAPAARRPAAPAEADRTLEAPASALGVLALQRAAGNHAVARLLRPDADARGTGPAAALQRSAGARLDRCPGCGQTCAETEEEEAPEADLVSAAVDVEAIAPAHDRLAGGEGRGDLAKCGATASTDVGAGAQPSQPVPADFYGLTWPEDIEVTITACRQGAKWVPGVTRVVGRYSIQTRLLPGRNEVTGPGGNTSRANFCAQVKGLDSLGNEGSWYMLAAVVDHEKVHEARLLPALERQTPLLVAVLNMVSVADDGKMDAAAAAKAIAGEPRFVNAVKRAKRAWTNDVADQGKEIHKKGGPAEQAERAVVDPMIAAICDEGRKRAWPACPVCKQTSGRPTN